MVAELLLGTNWAGLSRASMWLVFEVREPTPAAVPHSLGLRTSSAWPAHRLHSHSTSEVMPYSWCYSLEGEVPTVGTALYQVPRVGTFPYLNNASVMATHLEASSSIHVLLVRS